MCCEKGIPMIPFKGVASDLAQKLSVSDHSDGFRLCCLGVTKVGDFY